MSRNGYLYVWVSNETQGWDVFFDNFLVQYKQGPVLEENHYYPFGLTMAGISDKAVKTNYAENKYRYNKGSELQNKEFSDGSGLELYTTNYRLFDPQLGIFHQIDPLAEINEDQSPYSYAQNDPVLYNDPFGLLSDSSKPQVLPTATVTGHTNQSSASSLPSLLQPRVADALRAVRPVTSPINPTTRFIAAEVANKAYAEPAYAKGTTVTQYRTMIKQKFVRVFNPKNGNAAQGKWMMKESEIQGLSPEQIQSRFALPGQNAPSEMVEVEVPAGTLMQVGYAGTNAFGTGGGVQFEVMEAIPSSSFGTPTALPVPSVPMEMPAVEFPEEPIIPEGEFIPGEFLP
jgi:RHS repeat-associated protein